jgi:hypothetical protein
MAWGRGGRAFGWGSYAYPPAAPSPETEKRFIEDELRGLKTEMEALERRLGELKEGNEKS